MDNEPQAFDRIGAAQPADACGRLPDTAWDVDSAIGYEAADPSLQAPLWLEATLALHAWRDER